MQNTIPLLGPVIASLAILIVAAGAIWWSSRSVRRANELVMRTTSELRISEDRYHRFFNESPVALYRTTPDGAILEANKALAELLGYESPTELVGANARSHHANPATRDEFRLVLDQSRVVESRTVELRHRDGTLFWVVDTTVAVRGPDGKVLHYEGCLVDVTEARIAQANVAASERRFRALLDQSADGIGIVGADGRIIYMSPTAERLLGRAPGERIGVPFDDAIHEDDRPKAVELFRTLTATPGKVVRTEIRVGHTNGGWRLLQLDSTNRINDPDVQGIVVNFRDVTARVAGAA